MTTLLPAPEMSKNGLNCSKMCLCNGCENTSRDEDLDDVDIDNYDENDNIEEDD